MNTDQAADLLQGQEGSIARLVVVGVDEVRRRLSVRREHVEVPSVDDVKMIDRDSGVAYLKLTCFQKTTSRDLDTALWKLHREGMRCLIMDLRGNPGGLLTASVEVADKFVEEGVLVSTRGRSTLEDFNYTAHKAGTWRVPLVVLIDGESASASEIFAGAIRDHRRGNIVGQRSYGKGSVQGIFPLSLAGAGVRLTTAKFYSPLGHPISNVGVQPDIVVHRTARPVGEGQVAAIADPVDDPVLGAAIKTARSHTASR
jgi:carboxyl-terminal processing protease